MLGCCGRHESGGKHMLGVRPTARFDPSPVPMQSVYSYDWVLVGVVPISRQHPAFIIRGWLGVPLRYTRSRHVATPDACRATSSMSGGLIGQ